MFEWDTIKKEYLETFEVDENTDISALTLILDEKEREYIQKYKSNDKEFGYNNTMAVLMEKDMSVPTNIRKS